jgi:TRAP-type C4-dicarboxylate transport system permease small subunit
MKILSQVTERLTNVAMVAIVGLMLLTAADVFMRYTFSRPIQGVAETTELSMIVITFFAIGSVTFLRKHIAVDLVVDRFSPRVQAIIEIFTSLISVGICSILSWRGFVEAVITGRLKILSSQLDIPESPFRYVLAVGFAIVAVIALFQLIESIGKAVKK